ncbi:universal stress protein [Natrarchaeobaculum aegyptiacum]|uniref:Universal stress protein UspA n=1 Tax=Natrarchaeobaculum aegyptiacum TaxID=745377 RepID=A0A2Z2HUV5_9EURY|nr:universal stress protein [Natrarchaeobaculum aegyptiacum]ARS90970.1 universal stress protein UspA [Natrarchaeobaculum aegyptiacum]
MAEPSGDDPALLVPIVNEQTATRQLDTAIDLARDRDARIHLLFVLEVPSQLSLADGRRYLLEDEHQTLVADAAERVAAHDVPVEEHVRMARGVARGIVGAASEYDVDEILLGWRGRPPREQIVLGNHVDAVLQSAPCDVLVRRIKTETPTIGSILVGVAGGPHGTYAADVAASIARERDASVTLAHVHDPGDGDLEYGEAEALLVRTAERFDGVDHVEREVVSRSSISSALTDLSADHDLTVLGVSEGGLIRRRLLGTVSNAVGRHAAGTVILAKRRDPVPSRLRRLLS